MPGIASLTATEYYAHPRNIFWDIIQTLYGIPRSLPFQQRVAQLQSHGIGLWDVLQSCEREGSLDSNIITPQANDFESFCTEHLQVNTLFFNGKAAHNMFKKLVINGPQQLPSKLQYIALPSTSPANAGMSYANKLAAWQSLLTHTVA